MFIEMNQRVLVSTILYALGVVGASGCATVSSTKAAPIQEARAVKIAASCPEVRAALPTGLGRLGFLIEEIVETNTCEVTILATKGGSAFSWGEVVRVSVAEVSARSTQLQITTKRRLITNIFAPTDWSTPIAMAVREGLGQ
jgi:hypothetical protein